MGNFDFLNDGDPNPIRINTRSGSRSKPRRKSSESAKGCLALLLMVGGCVYWANVEQPPRPRNTIGEAGPIRAESPRAARADDYVPPPLGDNPQRYFGQLYRDLKRFRDDPLFREVGWMQGQRFFPWRQVVLKHGVHDSVEAQAAWGKDWLRKWVLWQNQDHAHSLILPSELLALGGNAYSRPVWPYDEMSENWELQFGNER